MLSLPRVICALASLIWIGLYPLFAELETNTVVAVDAVAEALQQVTDPEGDSETRQAALATLQSMGRQVRSSVEALLLVVSEAKAPLPLRRQAVATLGVVGLETEEQAERLFRLLNQRETDRDLRADILMTFGDRKEWLSALVPEWVQLVADPQEDRELRHRALYSLRRWGTQADVVGLAEVLGNRTDDSGLRRAVLDVLRVRVADAPSVVAIFAERAGDVQEEEELRREALAALRAAGPGARSAAGLLMDLVEDEAAALELRRYAAQALQQTGWPDAMNARVLAFVERLTEPVEVRSVAAEWLPGLDSWIGAQPDRWWGLVTTTNQLPMVRQLAARHLARQTRLNPAQVTLARRLFRLRSEDPTVRLAAGEALIRSGGANATLRDGFLEMLRDSEELHAVKELAARGVVGSCRELLEEPDQWTSAGLSAKLGILASVREAVEQALPDGDTRREALRAVSQIEDVLVAERQRRWWGRAKDWAAAHPVGAGASGLLVVLVLVGIGLTLVWAVLSVWAPLTVWRLCERWGRQGTDKTRVGGIRRLGWHQITLVAFWGRRPRVLDAAVRELLPALQVAWESVRQSSGAEAYLDSPLTFDGETCPQVPWEKFYPYLTRSDSVCWVEGESGTGKTVLSSELARRLCKLQMAGATAEPLVVPIWSSPPLRSSETTCLYDLLPRAAAPSDPAHRFQVAGLDSLLRQGRVLLVVDGFSEWSAENRQTLQSAISSGEGPHPPLLFTARNSEGWPGQISCRAELTGSSGAAVASWVSRYLVVRRRPGGLTETELLDACRYWSEITGGRGIPVEIVQRFADFLGDSAGQSPAIPYPENLGDLLAQVTARRFLASYEGSMARERFNPLAEELAWVGLSRVHESTPASWAALIHEMTGEPEESRALEEWVRQGDLWRILREGEQVRLRATPVLDYLAARHLMSRFGDEEAAWREVFQSEPAPGEGPLYGLGRALLDCDFQWSRPLAPPALPAWVTRELEQRMRWDPATRLAWRQAVRVRQLVRAVLTPENHGRSEAIEELARLGERAGSAVPVLIRAFRDSQEDLDVRQGALTVLRLLGPVAGPVVPSLLESVLQRGLHSFFRMKAIEILGDLGHGRPEVQATLARLFADDDEPEFLRLKAGRALLLLQVERASIRPLLESLPMSSLSPGLRQVAKELSSVGP